ncbi:hypothetical protein HaLaN_07741, partial [Haematococcus lacustris]
LTSSGTAVRADCEPGGLSAEGSRGKAPELLSLRLGVTTSHFIALRLERPAGVRPLLLQLPWPISSGANEPDGMPLGCYSGGQGLESVKLRSKSGQVWLKLHKAELLALYMNTMSTRQQMVQQAQNILGNGNAESELRESIKTLFVRATEGVRFFAVENMAGQPPLEGCQAELFVLLHLPILEGPDGGPILPITVVDNSPPTAKSDACPNSSMTRPRPPGLLATSVHDMQSTWVRGDRGEQLCPTHVASLSCDAICPCQAKWKGFELMAGLKL